MNYFPPFVILSAWNRHNSDAINEDCMNVMGRQIEVRGFIFGHVTRVDTGLGEEPAFVVPLNTQEQRDKAYCLYQLARHYAQANVLFVDANRLASVLDLAEGKGGPDVERETILGKFESISPLEASLRAQYIRDHNGVAYAITPGSNS